MNDFQQAIGDDEGHEGFPGAFLPTDSDKDTKTSQSEKREQANGTGERLGTSVYVANLQWWTTDAEVERLCSTYGQVLNVNFLAERSNGKSKGVALVEFADAPSAARCKEGLSGCSIHGRTCVVTFPNQSYQRPYGGRYGYYDRGRHDGRGRGRHGRYGGYEGRGMMHMDVPGYVHEMGMMDMPPEAMGMPPVEGPMGGPGYVPPPPYPIPGGAGYVHDDHYDHPYMRRGERWDHMEQEDMAQKRQRPTS